MTTATDVAVIGGGVVGVSVASSLSRRGRHVVVVDAGPPRTGTSLANAGHLVPGDVVPFAAPGMVSAGLRSLLSRDGAFAVNRRVGPAVLPWLAQFTAACDVANVNRAAPALRSLLDLTVEQVSRLAQAGHEVDLDRCGLARVSTSPRSWAAVQHEVNELRGLGVEAVELTAEQISLREPLLRAVVGALLLPRDGRVDPALLVEGLSQEARSLGARFVEAEVADLIPGRREVRVVTSNGELTAEQVVLAAGVWTPTLLRRLGVPVPILAAKGYSITTPGLEVTPRGPLLFVDEHIAVTPMSRGLRITGRFELTTPGDRTIPRGRIESLLSAAKRVLELPADLEPSHPWTGLRPATPDGLPLVGRLPSHDRVLVAAGHGMLGTSTGPGTGEVVAAMVCAERALMDASPLAVTRFRGWTRRAR
jgi:D-amino-acid dehydrogenase